MDKEKVDEVIKKFRIDLDKLKKEQIKLSEKLNLKDKIDFSIVSRIGGISNSFSGNKIISAVVVLNSDFEILEQEYFSEKVKFPYISGFRAYRELPSMISVFEKLQEKPDVLFVDGHGVSHKRLGLASHFSLVTGVPSIGIAKSLLVGEIRKEKDRESVFLNNRKVGEILYTKKGSKPLFVSSGNLISLDSCVKLTKKFVKEPHKLPEPLHLAHKYAKKVRKELVG